MSNINNLIPEIIRNDMDEIVKSFSESPFADNIIKIILFGSFANNQYKDYSDIDIAVVVKSKPEKNQLVDYYLITDNIRREIDLLFCTEEQLLSGKYVYSEIMREGIIIYENI